MAVPLLSPFIFTETQVVTGATELVVSVSSSSALGAQQLVASRSPRQGLVPPLSQALLSEGSLWGMQQGWASPPAPPAPALSASLCGLRSAPCSYGIRVSHTTAWTGARVPSAAPVVALQFVF